MPQRKEDNCDNKVSARHIYYVTQSLTVYFNGTEFPHRDDVVMHLDRHRTWTHYIKTIREEININYEHLLILGE